MGVSKILEILKENGKNAKILGNINFGFFLMQRAFQTIPAHLMNFKMLQTRQKSRRRGLRWPGLMLLSSLHWTREVTSGKASERETLKSRNMHQFVSLFRDILKISKYSQTRHKS
jgi:hypothetical protein